MPGRIRTHKVPKRLQTFIGKQIVVSKKVFFHGPKNWEIEFRKVRYDPKKGKLFFKYKGKKHYIKPSDIKR